MGLVKLGKLSGLDLFSGIGGIGLALEEWARVVAYCERDRYAQGVLLSRMAERQIASVPIWDDVTTLKGEMLPRIDIIFGGFPCQDISVAGAGKGLAGERSGLFFEIVRLTKETRAPLVFLENVPAIRTRGLRQVVGAFTEMGYDCRWTCISAASLGAPHKRERWFLLAHTKSIRGRIQQVSRSKLKNQAHTIHYGKKESLADSSRAGLQAQRIEGGLSAQTIYRTSAEFERGGGPQDWRDWWAIEPAVGRVAHGIPFRVDRLKCLGNSVVPIQAKTAFKRLIGLELNDSIDLL